MTPRAEPHEPACDPKANCGLCSPEAEQQPERWEDKPYLSVSQVGMHTRCELQWYYRYGEGIKSPPGVAQVIGKGTHSGVRRNLQQKIDWGTLLSTDELRDVTRDAFARHWDKEPPLVQEEDPDRGQATDLAIALAVLHGNELAPTLEPIAVEQAFRIEIPDLPFDVVGVLDVETPTAIRDTKTKKKAPGERAALRSPQLVAYHLRATLGGHPEKTVALDCLVKTKVPKVVIREAQPTHDDHMAFLYRTELAARSIKSGIFKPTDPDSWQCSQRFCGYWDICPFGSRKAVSVGLVDPARLSAKVIRHPHDDTEEETDDAA